MNILNNFFSYKNGAYFLHQLWFFTIYYSLSISLRQISNKNDRDWRRVTKRPSSYGYWNVYKPILGDIVWNTVVIAYLNISPLLRKGGGAGTLARIPRSICFLIQWEKRKTSRGCDVYFVRQYFPVFQWKTKKNSRAELFPRLNWRRADPMVCFWLLCPMFSFVVYAFDWNILEGLLGTNAPSPLLASAEQVSEEIGDSVFFSARRQVCFLNICSSWSFWAFRAAISVSNVSFSCSRPSDSWGKKEDHFWALELCSEIVHGPRSARPSTKERTHVAPSAHCSRRDLHWISQGLAQTMQYKLGLLQVNKETGGKWMYCNDTLE